jgi:hypothetical protein
MCARLWFALSGAVAASAIAVGSPALAKSLKSLVRTLNAIVNPENAWRLEDQARRYHRPNEERYWRNHGAGLEQQRRDRGEAVPSRGEWHGYSSPIDPDEASRLQKPGAARSSLCRGALLVSLSPRARRAWTATVIPAAQLGLAPWTNTFDPLVALSFIAANTTQKGLGISVLIVPYRNPIATARCWRRSTGCRVDG